MPRVHNRHADALATLASKIDIPNEDIRVSSIRTTLQATAAEVTTADISNEQDWRTSIMKELPQPSSTLNIRSLKEFVIIDKELYY